MSDKRISISLDEYNMLHTETLAQKDTITCLTAEVEWHKQNSDKWQDTQAAHLREVTRLTAEVEKLKRQVAEWVDAGGEAHSVIQRQMEDRAKLRAALLVARKYVLVQSCELSLMPEDAARDLDIIDEALEEDDDQG